MIRSFIQITAILLTLSSAFFLARGNISLSPQDIARISELRAGGYNETVVRSVSRQNADTLVGVGLLVVALCLQITDTFWAKRWADFSINKCGALLALIVCFLVFIGCCVISNKIASVKESETLRILNTMK